MTFPTTFLWGAATSAHQIEGYPHADGGGMSIWDRYAGTPGWTRNNEHALIACDHYHRWQEDIQWMKKMGLQAYRFSTAWARILPEGTGRVNPAGLAFYDRLVDGLLEAGIQPWLTLYHWDLPAALDNRGGWLNPDIPHWFSDYAEVMYKALGDRVTGWMTINEPWVVVDGGYMEGGMAPGHRNLFEAPLAAHHVLLAHAEATRTLKSLGAERVGLVVNLEPKYAASNSAEDLEATARAEAYMNHWYLDPVLLGRYPERLASLFGKAWPHFPESEMERIHAPMDFLGVNYYTRGVMKAADVPTYGYTRVPQPQHTHTEMAWEVYPDGLRDTLTRLHDRYPNLPPIYITENGSAFYDPPVALANPHPDPLRTAYLETHLNAVSQAMAAGVDVRGYFAWSLLDNYEWAQGFDKRFGLIHVHFPTGNRTLKQTALRYAEIIRHYTTG